MSDEFDDSEFDHFDQELKNLLSSATDEALDHVSDEPQAPYGGDPKRSNQYEVELQFLSRYTITVTANSPEEAVKEALAASDSLSADETRYHVGYVQVVTPQTVQRLEAAWDLINHSQAAPLRKQVDGLQLLREAKQMLETQELDVGEQDRLQYLIGAIAKDLTLPPEASDE